MLFYATKEEEERRSQLCKKGAKKASGANGAFSMTREDPRYCWEASGVLLKSVKKEGVLRPTSFSGHDAGGG